MHTNNDANNVNSNSKKDLPINDPHTTNKINGTNQNNTTNDNNKKKEITDEEAAVKIQSSFRGFKTREEIRKNVNKKQYLNFYFILTKMVFDFESLSYLFLLFVASLLFFLYFRLLKSKSIYTNSHLKFANDFILFHFRKSLMQ